MDSRVPRVLDLSFNLIRTIPDSLSRLTSLATIYFVQNRISKITGLDDLTSLRSLELGGNRIRVSALLTAEKEVDRLDMHRKSKISMLW